jgi:hypothetical protein
VYSLGHRPLDRFGPCRRSTQARLGGRDRSEMISSSTSRSR